MRKAAFSWVSRRSLAPVPAGKAGLRVAGIDTGLAVLVVVVPSKRAITPYDWAKKRQVRKMVCTLPNPDEVTRPDPAADGLTIAICHVFSSQTSRATSMASGR
jgi:Holliday junction resolvasome RuvABC endonuclease subunit